MDWVRLPKTELGGGGKKPAEFSRHTQAAQKQEEQFAELLQCAAIPFYEFVFFFIEYLPTQTNKALLQKSTNTSANKYLINSINESPANELHINPGKHTQLHHCRCAINQFTINGYFSMSNCLNQGDNTFI